MGFPDGINRHDGNKPYPHPHVICIRCKIIVDPDLDSLDELKNEAALETNFNILSHGLDFFGICGNCMAETVEYIFSALFENYYHMIFFVDLNW